MRNLTLTILCVGLMLVLALITGLVTAEPKPIKSLGPKASDNQHFVVSLAPRDKLLLGQYHAWTVELSDAGGKAVDNARIAISGGMAAHGHGLPSQPQVTKYLGDGRYQIEGLLFNMAGDWHLQLAIATPQFTDRVRFDFSVAF